MTVFIIIQLVLAVTFTANVASKQRKDICKRDSSRSFCK